jgi:hypothetical protein
MTASQSLQEIMPATLSPILAFSKSILCEIGESGDPQFKFRHVYCFSGFFSRPPPILEIPITSAPIRPFTVYFQLAWFLCFLAVVAS